MAPTHWCPSITTPRPGLMAAGGAEPHGLEQSVLAVVFFWVVTKVRGVCWKSRSSFSLFINRAQFPEAKRHWEDSC